MNFHTIKVAYYDMLYHSINSFLNNKFYDDAIMISGTTRGGTTWLMEMLWTKEMQVVWEPTKYETLVAVKGKEFADELGVIPYIPLQENWDEAYAYFNKLFISYHHNGINVNSHPLLLTPPWYKKRLLLKFCNINLLIPWLCKNFNIRPLVILRNPIDVVMSQLAHKGYGDLWTKYNIFEYNKPKYKGIFEKYERQFSTINSKVAMLTHWWVIQNIELIQYQNTAHPWKLIWYDALVKDTGVMMTEIFEEYKISKKINDIDPLQRSATSNVRRQHHNTNYDAIVKEVLDILEMYDIADKISYY